jgi:hypothetical protein
MRNYIVDLEIADKREADMLAESYCPLSLFPLATNDFKVAEELFCKACHWYLKMVPPIVSEKDTYTRAGGEENRYRVIFKSY